MREECNPDGGYLVPEVIVENKKAYRLVFTGVLEDGLEVSISIRRAQGNSGLLMLLGSW